MPQYFTTDDFYAPILLVACHLRPVIADADGRYDAWPTRSHVELITTRTRDFPRSGQTQPLSPLCRIVGLGFIVLEHVQGPHDKAEIGFRCGESGGSLLHHFLDVRFRFVELQSNLSCRRGRPCVDSVFCLRGVDLGDGIAAKVHAVHRESPDAIVVGLFTSRWQGFTMPVEDPSHAGRDRSQLETRYRDFEVSTPVRKSVRLLPLGLVHHILAAVEPKARQARRGLDLHHQAMAIELDTRGGTQQDKKCFPRRMWKRDSNAGYDARQRDGAASLEKTEKYGIQIVGPCFR